MADNTPIECIDATVLTEKYGLPLPLVYICEGIFERLLRQSKQMAAEFYAAIPDAIGCDGKDLSRVHWAFLAAELRAIPPHPYIIPAVIERVIAGMDLLAKGKVWPSADARAAARAAADAGAAYAIGDAAYAAPRAAAYAARAAYAAADAARADAAYAARAARADAAYAAADAARAARAARAAADAGLDPDAALIRQRDTLLALIAGAPVKVAA